jgi:lysophospholipase L1-like esterase
VFASGTLSLVLLEVSARVLAHHEDRNIFDEVTRSAPGFGPEDDVELRQLMRLSDDPNVLYELFPGVSARYLGQPYRSNAAGFRDEEVNPAPATDTYRVVGLGDSVMFGWGVANGEDYLSLVEQRLRDTCTGRDWEIINTAVPGYNTVMELATLKNKALAYDPDLVVLGWVGNDIELPNFIRRRRNVFDLGHSFLEQRLRYARKGKRAPSLEVVPGISGMMERNPELVAPEYRHLVGWNACVAALRELGELRELHGFDLLVVMLTSSKNRDLRPEELFNELRFETVEAGDTFDTYMREHGIDSYVGSELTLSEKDHHPSGLGHRLLAERLFEAIADRVGCR